MKKIECEIRHIEDNDDFIQVANLIYSTDDYVYPALFGTIENARVILPEMISEDSSIFGKSNILVACHDNHIIGVIVEINKYYKWDNKYFIRKSENNGLPLSSGYRSVVENYFMDLNKINFAETHYILCLSVTELYRNLGVGYFLMKYSIENSNKPHVRLDVLENNVNAILLYNRLGFHVIGKSKGFSANKNEILSALTMDKTLV